MEHFADMVSLGINQLDLKSKNHVPGGQTCPDDNPG